MRPSTQVLNYIIGKRNNWSPVWKRPWEDGNNQKPGFNSNIIAFSIHCFPATEEASIIALSYCIPEKENRHSI